MISLVVALARNNVIGKEGSMPWYYPEDLKYFKKLTMGHKILMGRKTFESIIRRNNKILPGRKHYVLTRDLNFSFPEVEVLHNLDLFLKNIGDEEIFIIGGAEIYKAALTYADRLYITHINKEYEGDVYFPELDLNNFHLISEQTVNELAFCVYERIKEC